MPITIEDMQAEVRPEADRATEAPAQPRPEATREAALEQLLRELRLREERRLRWQAD